MKVIICGAGQVGWQIARHLSGEQNDVTIVDVNSELVRRATETLDVGGVVLCVAMMSVSGLFYIIGGQYLVAKVWSLVPISGYAPGMDALRFLWLPVLVGVGVSNADQAREACAVADGVVMGASVVRRILEGMGSGAFRSHCLNPS